ncbi:MAG: adenosine kinase, partial [Acidimicrobiales bacterium]
MPEPTWPFDPPPTARLGPDVVCLGNALVDRLVMASEDAVAAARLEAGAMTLVDGKRAEEIEASCSGWHEVAGGSAANTAAGIASLGGRALFAGAVGDDPAGRRYAADLEKSGVRCITPAARSGHPTGVCHVFVSEGGARTMATSLGAAGELSLEAVELAEIESAAVLYVEGYLLDAPPAAAALDSALEIARKSGTLVSLSLSDPFVVERHRDKIAELVASGRVDLVLGNEAEALSLTG